jgi:hypothetical protein
MGYGHAKLHGFLQQQMHEALIIHCNYLRLVTSKPLHHCLTRLELIYMLLSFLPMTPFTQYVKSFTIVVLEISQ